MKHKALLLLLGVFLTSQAVYSEIKDTKAEAVKKTEIKQVQNEKSPAENPAPESLAPAENNEVKAETVRKTVPARGENNKNRKPVKTKRQKAEEKSRKTKEKDLSSDEKMRLQLIRMERMLKSLEGR